MSKPIKILLQTTIPTVEDDWHIGRFSLLRERRSSDWRVGGAEGAVVWIAIVDIRSPAGRVLMAMVFLSNGSRD
jgi:hypothetical protein